MSNKDNNEKNAARIEAGIVVAMVLLVTAVNAKEINTRFENMLNGLINEPAKEDVLDSLKSDNKPDIIR